MDQLLAQMSLKCMLRVRKAAWQSLAWLHISSAQAIYADTDDVTIRICYISTAYPELKLDDFTLEHLVLCVMDFDKAKVLHKLQIRVQTQEEDAGPGLRQFRSALNIIRRSLGIRVLLARLKVSERDKAFS